MKYEKFEEWMIGKTVLWDSNKGVVTRKHNDSDRHVWVEWENPDLDNAFIGIYYLVFLNVDGGSEKEDAPIPWEVGQEVYCVLHGSGVVQEVLPDNYSYPVKVDYEGEIYSYTKDGKIHKDHKGRVLFFSRPKIKAERIPRKRPFSPSFTRGETVVAKKKDGQSTVVFYVDKETETSVESSSCIYQKAEYSFYKIGVEVKF